MTTQIGYEVQCNGAIWYAVSDSGRMVGPSILIPVETIDGFSDNELAQTVRESIDQAYLAAAISTADHLLQYQSDGTHATDRNVARMLRQDPSQLKLLHRFANGSDIEIGQAIRYAEHCLSSYPEKPVTPKINKTPDVRVELQRKYHETFVKLGRRDGFMCQSCGSSDGDLQIDHVHPVSKGGTNNLDNLQLLCAACNLAKSDTVAEVCNG